MAAHDAKEARNASRSKLVESEQNVDRLKRQNEALLQERVELYMKMQARAALPCPHPRPRSSHNTHITHITHIVFSDAPNSLPPCRTSTTSSRS